MMNSSVVSLRPGTITARATATKVGTRIPDSSSDLVLDIWAMISLQQMLANTVPVR